MVLEKCFRFSLQLLEKSKKQRVKINMTLNTLISAAPQRLVLQSFSYFPILKLFDILPNFLFFSSVTKYDYS